MTLNNQSIGACMSNFTLSDKEYKKFVLSDDSETSIYIYFDDVDEGIGVNGKAVTEEMPSPPPPPPPVAAPPQNRRLLLLVLLFLLIGAAGGAYWLYSLNSDVKPMSRVVKPTPQLQSVKPVSPAPVEERIVVKKMTQTESESGVAQNTSGDQAAAVPVRDSSEIETVDVKVEEITLSPSTDPAKAVVSQSSVEGHEMLVARKAEVLDKPVAEPVKKTEAPTAPPGNAGEKTSVSAVKLAQDEPKVVAEIKPLEEAAPVAISKTEEPMVSPYAVHIGSFKSKKRASRQLAMLQKKGFAAYQVEVDLKGKGVWQRVLVPGGLTRKEAQAVQQKLADVFPREESLILKNKR